MYSQISSTIFVQSGATTTIFPLHIFVWLLFEGAVYLKKYGTLLLHNICNVVLHDVGRTGNHNMLLLQTTELSGYYSRTQTPL